MSDQRSLNLSTTRTAGQQATSDVDNTEAFAFYEINLHLRFEANQKH